MTSTGLRPVMFDVIWRAIVDENSRPLEDSVPWASNNERSRLPVSRWTAATLILSVAVGVVYLLGRCIGSQMVANGLGWEMAFYLSPIVFFVIDSLMVVTCVVGALGLIFVRGRERVLLGFIVASATTVFVAVPW